LGIGGMSDLVVNKVNELLNEEKWKNKFGNDLNWNLSFSQYKESETTKHVHRLHPYKGKFIPQLVEYFLDSHTDDFKKEVFFQEDDIILDPFSGSGTTMVQANELGMNAVGIDVSTKFNISVLNNFPLGINLIFQSKSLNFVVLIPISSTNHLSSKDSSRINLLIYGQYISPNISISCRIN
jgi:hypothetical protein